MIRRIYEEMNWWERFLAFLMWTWVAVAILAVASCMAKAEAHERECVAHKWVYRAWRPCDVSEGFFGSCPRAHWHRICLHWVHNGEDREEYYRRRDPRPERVYGYERRRDEYAGRLDDAVVERGACLERPVTGVSDEHKDVNNAKADSIKQWRKAVSWSGGGGEFMDYELARRRSFRCGPSSPGDNWTGRIGRSVTKAYGAVTGSQAVNAEGLSVRCQVWATPCRALRELDDGQAPPRP